MRRPMGRVYRVCSGEGIMTSHKEFKKAFFSHYHNDEHRWLELWKLIEADQAQYTALVDAAVVWVGRDNPLPEFVSPQWKALTDAIQPFLKPLLSEKLDKLAAMSQSIVISTEELRQLAAEARSMEEK